MERIVNGHYADANSTRDIKGITPDEYAVLIDVLREKYIGIEMIFSMDEDFKKNYVLQMLEACGHTVEGINYDKKIEKAMAILENQYAVIGSILKDINQPYPGAIYFPSE